MSKPLPPSPDLLQDPDPSVRGSRRKMTIYYNVNQEPDVGLPLAQLGTIDIADPIKQRYVEVLSKQTIDAKNSIPIANSTTVGHFYETADSQQVKYLANGENNPSGVPNASKNFFVTPSQFNFIGTDRKGVSEPNEFNTRTFQVNKYAKYINTDPTIHEDLIDKQLLSTTGFNSLESNQFVVVDGTQENPDNLLKIGPIYYNKKGAYKNSSFIGQPTLNGSTVTATSMSLEQMKKIGLNILYDAVQAGAGPDHDPTGTANGFSAAEVNMGVPSLPRLGKKVELSRFSPAHEAKKLFGVDKPNNPSFIDNDVGINPVMTYGNIYNPFAQFDSLVSLGQIAVCVAMVLAFIVLLELVVLFTKIPSYKTPQAYPYSSNNKKLLGSSTNQTLPVYPTDGMSAGEFLQQFLGTNGLFTYTYHSFDQCLQYGLQEFFGISRTSGIGAAFASGVLKILLENGRLNVVLREITRNGIDTIMGSDLASGGPYSIEAVGNLIKKIRDSKILGFINVLAQIGDKVSWEVYYQGSNQNSGSNISAVDSLPDSRPSIIAKSRLSNGTLAWGIGNSPMLHLPLTSLFVTGADSYNRLGAGIDESNRSIESLITLKDNLNNSALHPEIVASASVALGGEVGAFPTKNRLSKELVEKMEQQLEADYMPFYVQDLRTNEIISFHAFLEDAAEDFSVEYTQQDGYGRMDKVQIYKGTTRKINVSFKMVATNEDDHDLMWYKINRLAMTIYPQWTQGREVNVGGIKFIQPFSQIPGATPVIRLRLGDLWRSNYSKQSIARLFGATTREDFNLFGAASDEVRPTRERQRTNQYEQKIIKLHRAGAVNGSFTIAETTNDPPSINPNDIFIENKSKIYLISSYLCPFLNENMEPPTTGAVPQWATNGVIECLYLGTNSTKIRLQIKKFVGESTQLTPRSGKTSIRELSPGELKSWLRFDSTARGLLREESSIQQTEISQEQGLQTLTPTQFFDDTKNPILKSFSSTYGKGLAGVVTEFKVDYGEAKGAWGTDSDRFLRAPKFVTINLGMQVIHDIPLGLDANGIMNAPIWSVGNSSRAIGGIIEPVPTLRDKSFANNNGVSGFDPLVKPLINRRYENGNK